MKQVNKQNIHQKQSILCIICNTKIQVFRFFLFAMLLCEYVFTFDKTSRKSSPSLQGRKKGERRLWKVRKDNFLLPLKRWNDGKQYNLKDGEGLQVPCKIIIRRQKKKVNILKYELQKINEL